MCGIAGILSTTFDTQTIASHLEAMQSALSHRGPDGHGDYLSPSGHAGLAHTRLAIIDLSDKAHQPMIDRTSRFVISFNGEIYNHQSLRQELETLGHRFNSHSDTEVILALFQQFGKHCVKKLRGMFAFIIWDEQEKTAFAARDPFGIKPFYYWGNTHSFACASEIKAILKSNLSNKSLDKHGLYTYLKTGSVAEPNTLISDVKLLASGHHLSWRNGRIDIEPYWRIEFNDQALIPKTEAVKQTRSALESSIKAHLVSDVPVGLFLSGGIDSCALLALASKHSTKPINTYSIAFEDPKWNEGDIAKRVAKHFGAKHTELLMTRSIAEPLFQQYIDSIDQPTIDGFNTFCVSKLAHDHGEKVVLSGLGGDEIFAGYKSFELLPKMVMLSKRLNFLSPLLKLARSILKPLPSAKLKRILDFLSQPASLIAAHQSLRGIFSHQEAVALSQKISSAPNTQSIEQTEPDHSQLKDNISDLELSSYLRNQLVRDSDVMSMHWGLELRVPFLDSVLFDSIASIPAEIRLSQGKQLLIDAVPEIPEWVINRPKQGFRFPFDEWFSQSWQKSTRGTKPPFWIRLTPWYRRWSLVVLSNWIERHAK